jgi:glyceraldehyde 3-phosphate dehydrogenase
MLRVAINGYGRIGRCILRALVERDEAIELVAINDLADNTLLAHLTEFDSNHGRFRGAVSYTNSYLKLDTRSVLMLTESDPAKLPWKDLAIDIVFECTGRLKTLNDANKHLQAGAKKVLISAPMTDAQKTIVYGINHRSLTVKDIVVSNASCTTNCLAPIAKVLDDNWGIETGMMTTVHSYTNDQHLVDQAPGDFYRSRSAAMSMIPTTTGAANAVGLVLPQLLGRLHGMAIRVPTANVSVVDLHCVLKKDATVSEVNQAMKEAAEGELHEVLLYNIKPLVSVDFNHQSASSAFDANHTMIVGRQLKVMSWYDNEWGFSHRMLDTALQMHRVGY